MTFVTVFLLLFIGSLSEGFEKLTNPYEHFDASAANETFIRGNLSSPPSGGEGLLATSRPPGGEDDGVGKLVNPFEAYGEEEQSEPDVMGRIKIRFPKQTIVFDESNKRVIFPTSLPTVSRPGSGNEEIRLQKQQLINESSHGETVNYTGGIHSPVNDVLTIQPGQNQYAVSEDGPDEFVLLNLAKVPSPHVSAQNQPDQTEEEMTTHGEESFHSLPVAPPSTKSSLDLVNVNKVFPEDLTIPSSPTTNQNLSENSTPSASTEPTLSETFQPTADTPSASEAPESTSTILPTIASSTSNQLLAQNSSSTGQISPLSSTELYHSPADTDTLQLQPVMENKVQDLEALLVMNLLPHLRFVDEKWLDHQPKMEVVGQRGIAFHQDQLFIFYSTLLELEKIIGEALDGSTGARKNRLRTASYHNMKLVKLFFKFLYRSDQKSSKIILTSPRDAAKFNRHFKYLREMFPFL